MSAKKYGEYSKTFTLRQIFNDFTLKDILPMVNFKDNLQDDGKYNFKSSVQNISSIVYDRATSVARPFYKPLKASRKGNTIVINGITSTDLNTIKHAIYSDLVSRKYLLSYAVNNMECIRDAIKESEKAKYKYGTETKLYLRSKSKRDIRNMKTKEKVAFLENVMENIYYNDNFAKTRDKYKLDQVNVNSPYTYEQRKEQWERRVHYNG